MRLRFLDLLVYGAILAAVSLALRCAPLQTAGGAPRPAAETAPTRSPAVPRDTAAVEAGAYRFEDELPEETPTRAAQLVERIEPLEADTFAVQDMAVEEPQRQRYVIGYRVQVLASSDRAAAEEMKQRVVAQARMNAYIEYEDGLYKVRAGDFNERKDALQAKLALEKTFPGCWVVRTTIRGD